MKNIIKSQLYQLKKSRLVYGILLICLFLQFFSSLAMVLNGEPGEELSASGLLVYQGEAVYYIPLFFMSILTGLIAAADFTDKTINYEIMTGHKRSEVYLGRAVMSLLVSVVGGILLAAVPPVLMGIRYGWGTKLLLSRVLFRYGMLLFPYITIVCEFIFLSFVIKNPYVIMSLGYVYLLIGEYLVNAGKSSYLLGLSNISHLGNYHPAVTGDLLNNNELITIYNVGMSAGETVKIILASLLVGSFLLLLGYVFYKNDDL